MTEQLQILVVGSGGREHALAWKLAQSPRVAQVWVAPGNDGMIATGDANAAPIEIVPITEDDFEALIRFAHSKTIYLTIIGPEVPLAAGIVDAFHASGVRCFGPRQAAARIEGSKAFSKAFMERHNIPTARYAAFTDFEEAMDHLKTVDYQVVVKASGLAAGKGVVVTDSPQEAEAALRQILTERTFGSAGDEVIIEERLYGQEASILAFCDGYSIALMPAAQDHKPIFDGDQGPNTGGMGAYAPAPLVSNSLLDEVKQTVLQPAIDGLREEGMRFRGILFVGLMITDKGPRVLEFNCRLGDPETQAILPLLETDLVDIVEACLDGKLDQLSIHWASRAAATVVAASEGYPGTYLKGRQIMGLDKANAKLDTEVFQAGTKRTTDGKIVTIGGRVLAVTGTGDTLQQAIDNAYNGIQEIDFIGMHIRRDIGAKALSMVDS